MIGNKTLFSQRFYCSTRHCFLRDLTVLIQSVPIMNGRFVLSQSWSLHGCFVLPLKTGWTVDCPLT